MTSVEWPTAASEAPLRRMSTASRITIGCLLLYASLTAAFSKSFATIGLPPIYVADVLFVLAATTQVRRTQNARRHLGPLPRVLLLLIAVLAAQAVLRGLAHHEPGAQKGVILALYPAVSLRLANIFLDRSDLIPLVVRWISVSVVVGLPVAVMVHLSVGAAAYGLYLCVAAGYAVMRYRAKQPWFMVALIAAFSVLLATTAKRGPFIAVILSLLITAWGANSGSPNRRKMRWISSVLLILGITAGSLGLLGNRIESLPGVGPLATRAISGLTNPTSEAAANVTLRESFWRDSLAEVNHVAPLVGMGAGHPIPITDPAERTADNLLAGPHNSFVGYAFYAGLPCGLALFLLVLTLIIGLVRSRSDPLAAPLLGGLIGGSFIASTNVALESTYIAGIFWILIAMAMAVCARSIGRPLGGLSR